MKERQEEEITNNSVETLRDTITPQEFPSIHPEVFTTPGGTPYLKEPGVALISAPAVNLSGMQIFLDGYDPEYRFGEYLDDPTVPASSELLVKTAGQVCYASFGPQRTMNENSQRYIENLLASGHGSVLEHANYSVLLYGVSRSLTHELVRHRAGMGFSQLSQRYVSGKVLRFVERREFQTNQDLHEQFIKRIDIVSQTYEALSEELLGLQEKGDPSLSAEAKTDRRKKVQQTARAILPNETETVLVATGNARAWRHVINMRASEHAETEIREAIFRTYAILMKVSPILFGDFEPYQLPDGSFAVKTPYPKV